MKRSLLLALLWLFTLTPELQASCGSAICPIDTLSLERGGKGWIRVGYEFEYVDQDQPRVGTKKAAVGAIHGHHDEAYSVTRLHRWVASAGITDRLSVDLQIPFVNRSHQHVHHHHGSDIWDTWNLSGIGDLSVQARYIFFKPDEKSHPALSFILGGKFPTGAHHEESDSGSHAEVGVQPGTGSYDVLFGLGSHQTFSVPTPGGDYATLPFFVTATYQRNGESEDDYKLGNVFQANVGTSYPLTSWLGLLTQVNAKVRERDDQGRTSEEVGKTGGEFIYVSPGLEVWLSKRWSLMGLIQFPVYQRVNQIQLTSDYNLLAGLSYRFQIGS